MAAINNVVLYKTKLSNNTSNPYTRWFSSRSQQQSFFSSQIIKSFTNTTFQRINESARLLVNAESVANCNYMSFTNSEYNGRTWYAYIDSFRLESPNVTTVNFTIDPIQTFMFDIDIGESYVEREHVNSDGIGEWEEPEGFQTGEFVVTGNTVAFDEGPTCYAIFFNGNADVPGGSSTTIDGVFSGNRVSYVTDSQSAQAVIDYLTTLDPLPGLTGRINAVFAIPQNYIAGAISGAKAPQNLSISRPTTLRGYRPKNNKLFTREFLRIRAYNCQGGVAEYAFEDFPEGQGSFWINSFVNIPPKAMLVPTQGYKGAVFSGVIPGTSGRSGMPEEGLTMDIGTQLSYEPSATATIVSTAYSNFSNMAFSALSGLITGRPSKNSSFSVDAITDMAESAIMAPIQLQGQNGNFGANLKWDLNTFILRAMCPREEFIKKIDEKFTRYGYTVNMIKKPNLTGRPSWNFVKTAGANIIGNGIQNEWINKIRDMFDTGITLWHVNDIGNYSLDNTL